MTNNPGSNPNLSGESIKIHDMRAQPDSVSPPKQVEPKIGIETKIDSRSQILNTPPVEKPEQISNPTQSAAGPSEPAIVTKLPAQSPPPSQFANFQGAIKAFNNSAIGLNQLEAFIGLNDTNITPDSSKKQ